MTYSQTIRHAAINWPQYLGDVESGLLWAFAGMDDDFYRPAYLLNDEEKFNQSLVYMLLVAEALESDDTKRIDWLADKNNDIGNVTLPVDCIRANLSSLRGAIDMAMEIKHDPLISELLAIKIDAEFGKLIKTNPQLKS